MIGAASVRVGLLPKAALALMWFTASFVAQAIFDRADSTMPVRLAAMATVVVPIALGVVWARMWMRTADEYQHLLYYRSISLAAMTAVLVGVMSHWAAPLLHTDLFPVMTLPAWAVFCAIVSRRMVAA